MIPSSEARGPRHGPPNANAPACMHAHVRCMHARLCDDAIQSFPEVLAAVAVIVIVIVGVTVVVIVLMVIVIAIVIVIPITIINLSWDASVFQR